MVENALKAASQSVSCTVTGGFKGGIGRAKPNDAKADASPYHTSLRLRVCPETLDWGAKLSQHEAN
jgi:hypothetical protein